MKKSKIDKPLFFLMIIFIIFGLLMVLSASSMESYMRYDNSPYQYFFKQLIFYIGGLIGFTTMLFIPTKNYKNLSKMYLIGTVLALMGLTLYGYSANNAQSWFNLGFISIQPSEFFKTAIILYLALYYEKHLNDLDNQFNMLKPLFLIVVGFFLIIMQPDFGTALIVMILTMLIFYSVPIKKELKSNITKILVLGGILMAVIFVTSGTTILKDYQIERFNFLNPCDRYQEDSGYQLCNSFIAFNNGGLTGQGMGKSTQKYMYLPESYTDFIFPIIVEEWGAIVGILVIILYVVMLYRILRLAKKANTLRNSIIAYGVFTYLLLHILINLLGISGLMPLTGVPLPFLSYGGSFALSLMFAMGLVQRVAIETNRIKKVK